MAYRMSELTLTQDKSTDFADTFGFLQRRVENVVETNQIVNQVNINLMLNKFYNYSFIKSFNEINKNSYSATFNFNPSIKSL